MQEAANNGDVIAPGMLADRGMTKHKDNHNARIGWDDVKLIMINLGLITKAYAPKSGLKAELSNEENERLVCDLAVLTLLHESIHAQQDFLDIDAFESCWEFVAYIGEKALMEALKSDPLYPCPSKMLTALKCEILEVCARLDENFDKCFGTS